jgi:hypothetical protein
MNKRIQELAEQAEMAANMGDHVDVKLMMGKFAELIVQECIKLGQTGYSNDSALTIKHYSNKIKEHFGVNDE